MKRRIVAITICVIIILTVPITLLCMGFCLPAQYGNTYYAVLPKMYKRLKEVEGKKIIVVGNSAVAFGLNSDLMEREFPDYTVCSFGLYGAIGTKAMMDLSKHNIKSGDIVILAPEQSRQAQSLYFSGFYMWNALDGDLGLLNKLAWSNIGEMVGAFPAYVGRKYGYYRDNSAPDPTDVYASSSFNDELVMSYDRPYNRMQGMYDPNELISFDKDVFDDAFGEYVNEYNKFITSKGATLLYGFAPVNMMAVDPDATEQTISDFYDEVENKLDCTFLGNPANYFMDCEWFYDSNVHMNTAGSVVYTRQLACDVKAFLGDSTPVNIKIPEKPEVPDDGASGENGEDAMMFTYAERGSGLEITGLTAQGRTASELTVPDFYDGKKILYFTPETFAGNTALETLRLGKYVSSISDGSFIGCNSLKSIYVHAKNKPSDCHVYWALLEGAPNCKVYVPNDLLGDYINDYFWSRYGKFIVGY